MRIRPLSTTLANQIAAGEVIERPASVLKELVENSIDAGARAVVVDVEHGGMALVRVRDDGEGIHKDDLTLAVARHATSKLFAFEDLAAIATMGFRGEALPSIASVSRFELTSRERGADTAYAVRSDGSAIFSEPAPARHEDGTTVSVRDLFFNTPARRRFLRSEKTELRHIEQLLKRLALARFDLAFSLNHGGRSLIAVRAADTDAEKSNRIARLCGRTFADAATAVELQTGDIRLSGWVAGPAAARAYTDLQHFYVNGRIVRDSIARHALRQAYQDLIPAGRHPAYVLYLELDPGAVDVNVHPTKHEVRFRESRLVHDLLSRGVRRFLSGSHAVPGVEELPDAAGGAAVGGVDAGPPHAAPGIAACSQALADPFAAGSPTSARHGAIAASHEFHRAGAGAAIAERAQGARTGYGAGRIVRCTANGHLLFSGPQGIVVVDLGRALAALVRARWRRFDQIPGADEAGFVSRPLLLPEMASFDDATCDAVERTGESLERLGLDLRTTGPGRLALRAAPAALATADPTSVLHATVRAAARASAVPVAPPAPGPLLELILSDVDLASSVQRDHASLDTIVGTLERYDCLQPLGVPGKMPGYLGPPDGPPVARVVDDDALREWLQLEQIDKTSRT